VENGVIVRNLNYRRLLFLPKVQNLHLTKTNILFNGISSIKSGLFNIIFLNKLLLREWLTEYTCYQHISSGKTSSAK
jgi:hypothetical protein